MRNSDDSDQPFQRIRSVIPIDPDQTGVSAPLDAFADLRVCGSGQA
jgi:hypothetical protein